MGRAGGKWLRHRTTQGRYMTGRILLDLSPKRTGRLRLNVGLMPFQPEYKRPYVGRGATINIRSLQPNPTATSTQLRCLPPNLAVSSAFFDLSWPCGLVNSVDPAEGLCDLAILTSEG